MNERKCDERRFAHPNGERFIRETNAGIVERPACMAHGVNAEQSFCAEAECCKNDKRDAGCCQPKRDLTIPYVPVVAFSS